MRMAYTCAVIALMMVCIMPCQSIMQFSYQCEGKNATATTYNYLKEPRIEETGFTRGLKSGSFNYLENGDIDLRENINYYYYYGNGTNISNSTVNHDLTVEFKGDRGISEFFGRGYFSNNRWISAWKKIRYEESPSMKINGWSMVPRPSNSINVKASVFMNSSENASSTYIFNYHADIENGAIETKDATGWTNRSGSRKYDWEYETRSVGKVLNITNDLVESEDFLTAGPPTGDWLPCCYSGTIPTITNRFDVDYPWPSDVVIATLEANKLLPTKKLTSKQVVPAQLAPTSLVSAQYGNIYAKPSLRIGSIASIPGAKAAVAGPSVRSRYLYSTPGIEIGSTASVSGVLPIAPETSVTSGDLSYVKKNLKVGIVTAFPDLQLVPSSNGTKNINYITPPILENISCEEGGCNGYECIYTYDQDSAGATTAGQRASTQRSILRGETRNIRVLAYVFEVEPNTDHSFKTGGMPEKAQKERYNIVVTNNGDVPLSDVSITAEMARGMNYDRSVMYFESGTNSPLSPSGVPDEFDENAKTKLTWDIGIMQPNENKTILMETYQKNDTVNKFDLGVRVVGTAPDGILVRDSVNRAETACSIREKSGAEVSEAVLDLFRDRITDKIEEICPEWTSIQSI